MTFKKGEHVRYVPKHANGDESHKDCQHGVVSHCNDMYVFVIYTGNVRAQATTPEDLRR